LPKTVVHRLHQVNLSNGVRFAWCGMLRYDLRKQAVTFRTGANRTLISVAQSNHRLVIVRPNNLALGGGPAATARKVHDLRRVAALVVWVCGL
jgi:hypothetical protein